MKKTIPLLLISLFLLQCKEDETTFPENASFNPQSVSIGSIVNHVNILSGRQTFRLNGNSYSISSRNKYSEGNNIAANYIESQLRGFGYSVENQWFSETGRNLIAIKYGTEFPNQFFLIGAHYDSMPADGRAPGADDNASGTAAVLESARILSSMNSAYSIIFALWDEEEYGLSGSGYYAGRALDSLNILLVLNADMIAYDHDNDNIMGIYNSTFDDTTPYVEEIEQVNVENSFYIDLHRMNSSASSDDRAFSRVGFNAISFIEIHFNSDYDDFNSYWHSSEDTVDKFNMDFFERMSKLIITSLATLAGVYN